MDDIGAVMDAAGSERALQFGQQDGGMICALFAASYPERASGLILLNSSARGVWAPDFPGGWTEEEWDGYLAKIDAGWGTLAYTGEHLRWLAPNHPLDAATIDRWARFFRAAGSPGSMMALDRMVRDSDVRAILPTIQVPTLVMHAIDNPVEPIENARYTAERIPGATLVELPVDEHLPCWAAADAIVENVERFARRIRDDEVEFDRVLATVLFTDIVDSTAQGAAMGDRAWTELARGTIRIVRANLARFRGTRSRRWATGSSPRSTAPHEACDVPKRSQQVSGRSGSRSGRACIPGRWRSKATMSPVSAWLSAPASARKRGPNEVLVSQTVKDLVAGSDLTFEDAASTS